MNAEEDSFLSLWQAASVLFFHLFTTLFYLHIKSVSIYIYFVCFQDHFAFSKCKHFLYIILTLPSSLHFSLQRRLSSARILQYRHVWAACSRSLGSRNESTYSANCEKKRHSIPTFLWKIAKNSKLIFLYRMKYLQINVI